MIISLPYSIKQSSEEIRKGRCQPLSIGYCILFCASILGIDALVTEIDSPLDIFVLEVLFALFYDVAWFGYVHKVVEIDDYIVLLLGVRWWLLLL